MADTGADAATSSSGVRTSGVCTSTEDDCYITESVKTLECPIESATVYQNRAEVMRTMKFNPQKRGLHKLELTHIPGNAIQDSFRVRVLGKCTHINTNVSTEPITDVTQDQDAFLKEYQNLKQQVDKLVMREIDLRNQQQLMNQYCNDYTKHVPNNVCVNTAQCTQEATTKKEEEKNTDVQDPLGLNRIDNLLDTHEKFSLDSYQQMCELEENLTTLFEKIEILFDKYRQMFPFLVNWNRNNRNVEQLEALMIQTKTSFGNVGMYINKPQTYKVSVCVNLSDQFVLNDPIHVEVRYFVMDTYWKPAYALKVDTQNMDVLKVVYSGAITQNTNEDWTNVEVTLSSVEVLPLPPPEELPTCNITLKDKESKENKEKEKQSPMNRLASSNSFSRINSQSSNGEPRVPVLDSVVAAFDIKRRITIKAGTRDHKLNIADEELPAKFLRYCLPQQQTSCVLQVRATNTFKYPMINSHQAAVFIDGSFIFKTQVPATPIDSQFDAFLGTDPTIKVKLLPRNVKNKETGLIQKSHKTTFECPCTLKNCQQTEVRVAVVQQLPRSTDDKIKVTLLTPLKDKLIQVRGSKNDVGVVYEEEEVGGGSTSRMRGNADFRVVLNKTTNNITWDALLEPQIETGLSYSYAVEWPSDKEIEYSNTHELVTQ